MAIDQAAIDRAVADNQDLASFTAAVQDLVNNPPQAGSPATHEDAMATQAKLDQLIATVQALKDAQSKDTQGTDSQGTDTQPSGQPQE